MRNYKIYRPVSSDDEDATNKEAGVAESSSSNKISSCLEKIDRDTINKDNNNNNNIIVLMKNNSTTITECCNFNDTSRAKKKTDSRTDDEEDTNTYDHHDNTNNDIFLDEEVGRNDDFTEEAIVFQIISFESNAILYARRFLYLSHLMFQFSYIVWQFCIIILLLAVTNFNSLCFVSTYMLMSKLCLYLLVSSTSSENTYQNMMDCNNITSTGSNKNDNQQKIKDNYGLFYQFFFDNNSENNSNSNINNNNSNNNTNCENNNSDNDEKSSNANNNWITSPVVKDPLVIAQIFIWVKNACVVNVAILFFIFMELSARQSDNRNDNEDDSWLLGFQGVPNDWVSIILFLGIHMIGTLSEILHHTYQKSIVQYDWLLPMSQFAVIAKITTHTTNSNDNTTTTSTSTTTDSKHSSTTTETYNDHQMLQQKDSIRENAIQSKWLSKSLFIMEQLDSLLQVIIPITIGFIVTGSTTSTTAAAAADIVSTASNNTTIFIDNEEKQQQQQHMFQTATITCLLLIGATHILALIVETYCAERIYHLIPTIGAAAKEDNNDKNTTTTTTAPSPENPQGEEDKQHARDDLSSSNTNSDVNEDDVKNSEVTSDLVEEPNSNNNNNEQHNDDDDNFMITNAISATTIMQNEHFDLDLDMENDPCSIIVTDDVAVVTVGIRFLKLPYKLQIYLQQSIALGGIGLSTLHWNTLAFDSTLIAYLIWKTRLRFDIVGIWYSIYYIFYYSTTMLIDAIEQAHHHKHLEQRPKWIRYCYCINNSIYNRFFLLLLSIKQKSIIINNLIIAGLVCIIYIFVCISVSYIIFFCFYLLDNTDDNNNNKILSVFIGGVCFSRIGCILFEKTINNLLVRTTEEEATEELEQEDQELFDELEELENTKTATILNASNNNNTNHNILSSRNNANTNTKLIIHNHVQYSLNNFFYIFSFFIGIIFSDPRYLYINIVIGYIFVIATMVLYGYGIYYEYYRQKRRLFEEEQQQL